MRSGHALDGGLAELFALAPLKMLDVGARGGAADWTTVLARFSVYYACEPDEAARRKLKKGMKASQSWLKVVTLPEAIAEPAGEVTLNVTKHAGMSSLLEPDMEVVGALGMADEFTVVGQVTAPAIGMAAAAKKYGFEDLALIKVDTQGSELDVLRSGEALLAGPVQAVFVEVEFRPLYKGQPLFSEVELYLRGFGFELITLEPVTRRRTGAGAAVDYSRREIAWAHAFFMKRAPEPGVGDEERFARTVRQIALAVAREQFDLAAERLAAPAFQAQLQARGLRVGLEDLGDYVRRALSAGLYRDFVETWPETVKHRDMLFCER